MSALRVRDEGPKPMPAVLAIADDLTGALEAGAKFAERGVPSLVAAHPVRNICHPVLVIDTESRHLPPGEAAAVVARAAGTHAKILYKKTDSTLRGNIGAELRAMLALHPRARIAYVPAYPALGRTVRDGRLFVDRIPVHESAFARDALNPIADSSIAGLLGEDLPCTIFDGETDADVRRATAEALSGAGPTILAGPASVAAALAELLDISRQPVRPWPPVARCLILNGSLHEASAGQVAHAEAHSVAEWQVFHVPIPAGLTAPEAAAVIGHAVARRLDAADIDTLMVFGGDTAFGILKALGNPPLEPLGEVVTGVPLSRVVGRNLTLITKAGGFGGESLIDRVRESLHGNQR
jgi:uncharacterized protein YgbK (DUF1537 family)